MSTASKTDRMPAVFLPHGGGPWPFVDVGFGEPKELETLASYLRSVGKLPRAVPKALLVISAHWEESVPTVMTSPKPPMLYDYDGFPAESYRLSWPAPGSPALAARVQELLQARGIRSECDSSRGFDHGTFVPLMLAYPRAELPAIQLSLKQGLDPHEHLAIGRALEPLRGEGVFLIGSGMTYHNLRGFGPRGVQAAGEFDAWLQEATVQEASERNRRLTQWSAAPSARAAHPREEHLLPLMVIAGAAGEDRAQVGYSGTLMGIRLSAYHFG